MGSETIYDFPEFDGIGELNCEDSIVLLLKMARRFSAMADAAKKEAYERAKSYGDEEIITDSNGTSFKVTTRSTAKVDVSALKEMYPEVYKDICDKGEVTISVKAVDKSSIDGAIIQTKSRYPELIR